MSQDYCWIHGSSYIPPEYQPHLRCIVEQEGVQSADEAPDTSYYQWVTFMFCIQVSVTIITGCQMSLSLFLFQAALFYLPYRVWCALEGGVLSSFGTDGKTPVWKINFQTKEFLLKVIMIGDDQ